MGRPYQNPGKHGAHRVVEEGAGEIELRLEAGPEGQADVAVRGAALVQLNLRQAHGRVHTCVANGMEMTQTIFTPFPTVVRLAESATHFSFLHRSAANMDIYARDVATYLSDPPVPQLLPRRGAPMYTHTVHCAIAAP